MKIFTKPNLMFAGLMIVIIMLAVSLANNSDPTKNEPPTQQQLIERQFNPWNGSHIDLTRRIKKDMNDPDSFEHVETTFRRENGNIIVYEKFRGTNKFGAVVTNEIIAEYTMDGKFVGYR